ncbi:MAG TPA: glycosyltransferase family 87 protein [Pseudomonadales bacterium]
MLLALLLACIVASYFSYHVVEKYKRPVGNDLMVFVQASQNFWTTGQLYDRKEPLQITYQPGSATFKFPPPFQIALAPWVKKGIPENFFLYASAIMLLFYGLSVILLWKMSKPILERNTHTNNWTSKTLLACFILVTCLSFTPFFSAFTLLAIEIPLLFFILASFYFSKSKPALSGLLLALSSAIKIYPVFIILYFIIMKQWKVILFFIIGLFLTVALSISAFGVIENIFYFQKVLPVLLQEKPANHIENLGLEYSAFAMTGWPSLSGNLSLALRVFFLSATAFCIFSCRKILPYQEKKLFSLLLITMILMLNNRWVQYDLFLLLGIIILGANAIEKGNRGLIIFLAFTLLLIKPELEWAAIFTSDNPSETTKLPGKIESHGMLYALWNYDKTIATAWIFIQIKSIIPVILWAIYIRWIFLEKSFAQNQS